MSVRRAGAHEMKGRRDKELEEGGREAAAPAPEEEVRLEKRMLMSG